VPLAVNEGEGLRELAPLDAATLAEIRLAVQARRPRALALH
jgi:hypothetical protein